MTATFQLASERDRDFAIRLIQRTPLDGKNEVVIRRIKRTTKQERRMRSMIKAIMEAKATWAGREWDSGNWRAILISAYLTEKKQETGTIVEGMGGEFLVLGQRRGSDLDVDEWGEMMVSTLAWMDKNGIEWKELEAPADGRPEPPPRSDDR
jgi:hypothetical protein